MTSLLAHSSYQEEFKSFTAQERVGTVPHKPILFYGSSSFRLWENMAQDFAGLPVLNRGFGGSTLEECLVLLERWVLPVQPRAIVLYAGDNDLDHGAEPEQVLARFEEFCATLRKSLGWVPLLFVSIKPSPSRFWNSAKLEQTNKLIRQAIGTKWREAHFIDVYGAMLNAGGTPRTELFTEDGLHMNRAGYAIWQAAIRQGLAEIGLQSEARIP